MSGPQTQLGTSRGIAIPLIGHLGKLLTGDQYRSDQFFDSSRAALSIYAGDHDGAADTSVAAWLAAV